jgi:hypothetical protein
MGHCKMAPPLSLLLLGATTALLIIGSISFNQWDKGYQQYGIAIETTRDIEDKQEPIIVTDSCVATKSDISKYADCKIITPANYDGKTKTCAIKGGQCLKYAQVNCKPCYYSCKVHREQDQLSTDCTYQLQQSACSLHSQGFDWNHNPFTEFYCQKKPGTMASYYCSRGDLFRNDFTCEKRDLTCNCESVCTEVQPDQICNVFSAIMHHMVKYRQYTVDGQVYPSNVIRKDCRSDNPQCINDFNNNNPSKSIYYETDRPSKYYPYEPATTYSILFYICLVAAIIMGIIFCVYAGSYCSELSERNKYQEVPTKDDEIQQEGEINC